MRHGTKVSDRAQARGRVTMHRVHWCACFTVSSKTWSRVTRVHVNRRFSSATDEGGMPHRAQAAFRVATSLTRDGAANHAETVQ